MLPSIYLYHLHLLIYFSLQAGGCLDRSPVHHRKTNHAYTLVPKGNSEKPVHLTVMFLDCGRKPENQGRTHAFTGEHATPFRKAAAWDSNPGLLSSRQHCY
ncbi:hypothetical protein XENORESO_005696 [Xenotaenia resolanae]|uniref:Secreted protein n=1 Tax=Xenotaenia resolanae TaxID=208358 RepID=A0ABV0W1F0_9TELE